MPGNAPSPTEIGQQISNAARIAHTASRQSRSYSEYVRAINKALRECHNAQHNALFRRDIVDDQGTEFDTLTHLYDLALDKERCALEDWLKEARSCRRRWRQYFLQHRIDHLSKKQQKAS